MISNKHFLLAVTLTSFNLAAESIEQELVLEQELEPKSSDQTPFMAEVETPSADEVGSYAEDTGSNKILKLSIAGLSLAMIGTLLYNPTVNYWKSYQTYKDAISTKACKKLVQDILYDKTSWYFYNNVIITSNHYIRQSSTNKTLYDVYINLFNFYNVNYNEIYDTVGKLLNMMSNEADFNSLLNSTNHNYLYSNIEVNTHTPYKALTSELLAQVIYVNKSTCSDKFKTEEQKKYLAGYIKKIVEDHKKQLLQSYEPENSWSKLFRK